MAARLKNVSAKVGKKWNVINKAEFRIVHVVHAPRSMEREEA